MLVEWIGGYFFFPGKPPRPGSFGLPPRPVRPGKFGSPGRRPRENPSAAGHAAGAARHFLLQRLHLFRRGRLHAAAKAHRLREAGHRAALARAHGLHHVGHVPVHLQQLVDLLDLGPAPAAMRFLRLALRMSGFLRSCRVIESMIATWRFEHLVVDPGGGDLVLHLGDAGHHAHQPADAAHVRHLLQLVAHVVKVELALAHLLGGARGFFGVDIRGGLLDQRDDVAHAEDAAGDAARDENLPARRSFRRCRSA